MLIVIDTDNLIDSKVEKPHTSFERGWNHAIDEVIKASLKFVDVYTSFRIKRKESNMKKRGYTFPYFEKNYKELKDIFDKWENTNEPLTYIEVSKIMYAAREHMREREASSWK